MSYERLIHKCDKDLTQCWQIGQNGAQDENLEFHSSLQYFIILVFLNLNINQM